MTFVPANCTGELQPLDVSVNGVYKEYIKNKFISWYAGLVSDATKNHPDNLEAAAAVVKPDFRLSVVKPLRARWLMDSHS